MAILPKEANLFVKNVDDSINHEEFKRFFLQFGKIASIKLNNQ